LDDNRLISFDALKGKSVKVAKSAPALKDFRNQLPFSMQMKAVLLRNEQISANNTNQDMVVEMNIDQPPEEEESTNSEKGENTFPAGSSIQIHFELKNKMGVPLRKVSRPFKVKVGSSRPFEIRGSAPFIMTSVFPLPRQIETVEFKAEVVKNNPLMWELETQPLVVHTTSGSPELAVMKLKQNKNDIDINKEPINLLIGGNFSVTLELQDNHGNLTAIPDSLTTEISCLTEGPSEAEIKSEDDFGRRSRNPLDIKGMENCERNVRRVLFPAMQYLGIPQSAILCLTAKWKDSNTNQQKEWTKRISISFVEGK
jgi:hypothetical protein